MRSMVEGAGEHQDNPNHRCPSTALTRGPPPPSSTGEGYLSRVRSYFGNGTGLSDSVCR